MILCIGTVETRHTCQDGCALRGAMVMLCSLHAEALLKIGLPSTYSTCPAGFYRSAGCFFTFYLICVGSMLQMSAIYRLMAAASPNMDIASAAGEVQLIHSSQFCFHQTLYAACCQAHMQDTSFPR